MVHVNISRALVLFQGKGKGLMVVVVVVVEEKVSPSFIEFMSWPVFKDNPKINFALEALTKFKKSIHNV